MKYIFCDLDGTLLLDFYRIEEQDIKALLRAQEKGNFVSIATGRLDYEIKAIMEQYGFNGFRVSQNGGVVYSEQDKRVHAKFILKRKTLLKRLIF